MLRRLSPILFALALLATAVGLRWPGLGKTVWNLDEGSTFTMAEVVKHGGVMYRDAADNRTPLVPYAKAAILSVVGDWNIRGAHIVLALMLGLTAIWLWRLGRQSEDEVTGVMAAIFFTLLSFVMLGAIDSMSAHTGWFLIFFSALGMWAFVTAITRASGPLAVLAGFAFALAALSKQPGVLDWGVCLVLCVITAWTTPTRRRDCLRLAALLTVGLAAPLVATYWYFSAHGAWGDFPQYSWYYNTQLYVPEVPFRERLLGIRRPLQLARESTPFAFGLGIIGVGALLVSALPDLWKSKKAFQILPWLILGWLASGLVSTIISGRDFAHYSIQVLPGLSLACGWVAARAWERSASWRTRGPKFAPWLVRGGLGLGLLSLGWAAIQRASTFDLTDGISKDIGLAIKARTRPEERIFVWGYEPELHVFSERLPSTRFLYAVFLTGLIPWTNLDGLKNTDYAIVPGAWDAFWQDFNRRPPTIIVDTHNNRGFLKYPLRRQARLWSIVEKDYVEVEVTYATARGYTVYQRALTAPDAALAALPDDNRLQLIAPDRNSTGTPKVQVNTPEGTTAIDLYLDGKPYRRVENFGSHAVETKLFLLESDLAVGQHQLRAVARGAHDFASASHALLIEPRSTKTVLFDGPPLLFAGRNILPIESETITGQPVVHRSDNGMWDAHAPSRLVYVRPDGLTQIDFTFGMFAGSFDGSNPQKTDGVDVSVFFEDDQGKQTQLYRRRVDPVEQAEDQKPITGHANLPGLAGGKLLFLITAGPMNIPAFDWSYWSSIEGAPPYFTINFSGQLVIPTELKAKFGVSLIDYQKRKVLLAHAPSQVTLRQAANMVEFTGEFGLLDTAWNGPKQSGGAIFEIEQVRADGTVNPLFSRTLNPARVPGDRGVQTFSVTIPPSPGASLHLITRQAEPTDNSFNYTFWHGLAIAEFPATLPFEGKPIRSLHSDAVNGFANMDEDGARVLFAHAPSELVFPLEAAATQLTGTIGLIRGAYTGQGETEGAQFIVAVETADGKHRELFRRYLNPRAVPGDRGAVDFRVDLPTIPGGRLILRTESAPSGNLNSAWSYWGKLQLTR